MAKKKSAESTRTKTDVESAAQVSAPQVIGDDIDFEDALSEVEQIVAELEAGDLGLTESLGQYEVGVRRLKQCHAMLAEAEQRVSVLAGFDADGNPVTEPLDELKVRGGPSALKPKATRSQKRTATPIEGDESSLDDGQGEDGVDVAAGLF